ncbi:MAG: helix-turn-helix transcriptional regulator [Eubacterium sp.]|nr:helix-turn-helix transcriptional regulator [Eubacterium sp.]
MPGKKSETIKKCESELKKVLQHNIAEIRYNRKVTQHTISKALGISRETYSNYENRTIPPQYLIYQLAKVYNVSPSVFYDENLDVEKLFVENDNSEIYGENSFIDLSDDEKLFVMKIRQLNKKDREKLLKEINSILD